MAKVLVDQLTDLGSLSRIFDFGDRCVDQEHSISSRPLGCNLWDRSGG